MSGAGPPPDDSISRQEAQRRERLEQHSLSISRSATIAAWASVIASLFAVLISVYSAYLQRQQTRATFWPNLELSFSDAPSPRLQLLNTGVGPATLQWAELRYEGRVMRSWGALLKAAGASDLELDYAYSTIGNSRTIGAGAVVDIFIPQAGNAAVPQPQDQPDDDSLGMRSLNRIRGNPKVELDLCYCSIFDECTLLLDASGQQPVSRCPARKQDGFDN